MIGFPLLYDSQSAFDAFLIARIHPLGQVFSRKIFSAAKFVENVHNHLALSGVGFAVIGVILATVSVPQFSHLFFKQRVGNQPFAIGFEKLPSLEIRSSHKSLLLEKIVRMCDYSTTKPK